MIRTGIFGGALAMLAVSPAAAASGSSATAQGSVAAEVIEPIVVTMLSTLDFGMLTSSRTDRPGQWTIDPASSAHYLGGANPACLGGGGCPGVHASRFAVRGEAGRSYVVSAPAALVASGTLAGSGSAAPDLAIETLTVRTASRPGNAPSGTLDVNGRDHFSIGGTLVVSGRNWRGALSGHLSCCRKLQLNHMLGRSDRGCFALFLADRIESCLIC